MVLAPQAHCAIPTPTSESASIEAERDASDIQRMPCECVLVCARDGIPETDLFTTSTGQRTTIRAECDAHNHIRMPSEYPLVCSRHGIPQTADSVATPTCERTTIRAECDTTDHLCMPGEQGDFLMGCRIVEPDTDTTRDREASAIRRILYLIYHAFTEARFNPFG